jgi:hypothetical protein
MWKELTYPLVGQYLLTDGKNFSIANYQLNTLQLWKGSKNTSNNCSVTVSQR